MFCRFVAASESTRWRSDRRGGRAKITDGSLEARNPEHLVAKPQGVSTPALGTDVSLDLDVESDGGIKSEGGRVLAIAGIALEEGGDEKQEMMGEGVGVSTVRGVGERGDGGEEKVVERGERTMLGEAGDVLSAKEALIQVGRANGEGCGKCLGN